MRWRGVMTPWRVAMLTVLLAFALLALAGPIVWGGAADDIDVAVASQGTSLAHPFGTDALGRDTLARTLVATRLSLALALAVAFSGFGIGVLIGALPMLLGRGVQRAAVTTLNLLVAFPSVLLALLVLAVVGVGWQGAVIALAIAGAPQFGRVSQTLASQVVAADYISASRLVGVRSHRLLARHVLPNIGSPLALQLAAGCGGSLLGLSALSFLGVGVQEPEYDWGALVSAGLDRLYTAPAAALGPAAAIVLVSVAFNVLGDALADALALKAPAPRRRGAEEDVAVRDGSPAHVSTDAVLQVEALSVGFRTPEGTLTPVRDVSFVVRPGERLGIVGESGSGKSLTARAIAQLIEPPGWVRARLLAVDGIDLGTLDEGRRAHHLATSVAMVFQDPLGSLNPALKVGRQVTEGAEVHLDISRELLRERAIQHFRDLRVSGEERRLSQYPHELSGGMRQRAVIAMGLMNEPKLILADEPTSALDVTVQRQVLRTLHEVNVERGTAIVLISHDMAVVRAFCERVLVMYAGRVVEELEASRLDQAAHPYTRALLGAVLELDSDRDRPLTSVVGQPPSVGELPDGCAFAPRCPFATDRCHGELPPFAALAEDHRVACWHPRTALENVAPRVSA